MSGVAFQSRAPLLAAKTAGAAHEQRRVGSEEVAFSSPGQTFHADHGSLSPVPDLSDAVAHLDAGFEGRGRKSLMNCSPCDSICKRISTVPIIPASAVPPGMRA